MELIPPTQASPRDGHSLLAVAICVKSTTEIAGILHINSRKSRNFWIPYENIRGKVAHFLRKMKHVLWIHGASETLLPDQPLSLVSIGAEGGYGENPCLPALFSPGLMQRQFQDPSRLAGGDYGVEIPVDIWWGQASTRLQAGSSPQLRDTGS